MLKSREEDLMSRIFAWSQKCLPTDSLLVARRKICSHTMELNNTFQICRISVTCKGQHRHHVLLGVTPGKAHHHLGDSCCFVAMSCLTLFRPHGLQSIRLLSLGFPMQEYLSGLSFTSARYHSDSGIKRVSSTLAGRFFWDFTEPPEKPPLHFMLCFKNSTE